MATFHDLVIPKLPCCSICGCADVRLDYFDGDAPLELGECPRCSHRWTRSMLVAFRRSTENAAARLLADAHSLPHAA